MLSEKPYLLHCLFYCVGLSKIVDTPEIISSKFIPFSQRKRKTMVHSDCLTTRTMNRDWKELIERSSHVLSFISHIAHLQTGASLARFLQHKKESIGVARARFCTLKKSSLYLSLPDQALLQHFFLGLTRNLPNILTSPMEDLSCTRQ